VEVDGLGRTVVNLSLSLGDQREGVERESLRGRADGGSGDDLPDLRQAAMIVGMRVNVSLRRSVRVFVLVGVSVLMEDFAGQVDGAVDEDIDFGGSEAAALDTTGQQLSIDAEGRGDGLQLLQGDSGIYGCAEKHVATDSGETIQEGNTHYESEGRMPEAPI
jgi:hypothetical protein